MGETKLNGKVAKNVFWSMINQNKVGLWVIFNITVTWLKKKIKTLQKLEKKNNRNQVSCAWWCVP